MQRHLLLAMILVACTGDDSDSDAPLALAIAGAWVDDFGGTHDIDESTWDMGDFGLFHIDRFDNDAAFLVAHNDAGEHLQPGPVVADGLVDRRVERLVLSDRLRRGRRRRRARHARGGRHRPRDRRLRGIPVSYLTPR